jgi:hypothetical protein
MGGAGGRCFCSDGRQVRLVSFFVSSLFVPDAERAIVLAWRGIFLTRTEISRFFSHVWILFYDFFFSRRNLLQPAAQQMERVQCDEYV